MRRSLERLLERSDHWTVDIALDALTNSDLAEIIASEEFQNYDEEVRQKILSRQAEERARSEERARLEAELQSEYEEFAKEFEQTQSSHHSP